MRRGTTPTVTIKIDDVDLNNVVKAVVTFRQNTYPEILMDKEPEMIIGEDADYLKVTLTQEETLALKEEMPVEIQFKGKLTDGKVLASNIVCVPVKEVLNEVIL